MDTQDVTGDPTDHLDTELIFSGQGPNAEMEAMNIRNVLEESGITVITADVDPIPSLMIEVRVPHDQVDRARQALAEAEAAGPAAADEGELDSEQNPTLT
ncbi:MAG: hypothetical protein WBW33_10615 [Bryobacteraceae bacterium]